MRQHPVDDNGLWRRAVRDVKPLSGRPQHQADHGRLARAAAETYSLSAAIPRSVPGPVLQPQALPPLDRFVGVDRAIAERLKRGRYPIEARLDLHGMTEAEAHRELADFVAGSRAAGRRCLLVITGHGRSSGGVLKAAVPRWLSEPELRRHVLALAPAQPKAGGAGALYVLLRRLYRADDEANHD